MPPSAGACQTIEASVKPLWGRAAQWSSTMTATGWRAASSGFTRRPVSGATAGSGVGTGVGSGADGTPAGLSEPAGATAAVLADGDGAGPVGEPHAATTTIAATTSRSPRRGERRPAGSGFGWCLMPGGGYPDAVGWAR